LSTGLLTIAPTLPGTYNGTISATDTTGTSSTAPFTLVVQSGAATGTVPNVVGDTTAAAQTAIIAAGFPVGAVTSAPSTTAQDGFVISQAPSAGPGVLLTQPVSYVLGSGPVVPNPPVLELPNIVGQTQAEAQETLAEVGASVGMSTSSYDD
jgi:serine/threonine-protein kinase